MRTMNFVATVHALVQDPLKGGTAVLLETRGKDTVLPIWIGLPEALAISHALKGTKTARPLTHSLLVRTTQALNGNLHHIEITRLERDTFYASLHVVLGDETVIIDARPSDAIATALQAQVPILVRASVWNENCVPADDFGFVKHGTVHKSRSPQQLQLRLKRIRAHESGRE